MFIKISGGLIPLSKYFLSQGPGVFSVKSVESLLLASIEVTSSTK